MQKEKSKCPSCGANLTGRYERISKGLAFNLIEFRKQALKSLKNTKVNKVHLAKDLNLSKNQYNNFQKLRYHGLIAHYFNKEKNEYEAGYWLLTRRGNSFAKNDISISRKVLVFRNKIRERSEEKVSLSDILKKDDMPFWDKHDDYEYEFANVDDYKNTQDETNQLDLFYAPV